MTSESGAEGARAGSARFTSSGSPCGLENLKSSPPARRISVRTKKGNRVAETLLELHMIQGTYTAWTLTAGQEGWVEEMSQEPEA
jgi:hypothetical protein